MKVVIIKYNAGNTRSVQFALERLGIKALVSDNTEDIVSADKLIFPGVGEASSAMAYLKEKKLDQVLASLTQPVLGICLGMQLMCRYSEEGQTDGLGIFNQDVKRFSPSQETIKVPHMGWNEIYDLKTKLYDGVSEQAYVYFVHSYYAELGEHTIAKADYSIVYSSSLKKDNFYATQFHPEKSGDVGQRILENFIKL